jgi:hypothetical protein
LRRIAGRGRGAIFQPMQSLPTLALSVRQPSAWAILHGGKDIENRTLGAIRAGRMEPGRICIHAATGMREAEYRYIALRMAEIGVACPDPADLVRGAIIGTVEVTGIVTDSDSPWFGGAAGLALRDPRPVTPIPAKGALGYFRWTATDAVAPAAPWMIGWGQPGGDDRTAPLFDDLAPSYRTRPPRPWPKS